MRDMTEVEAAARRSAAPGNMNGLESLFEGLAGGNEDSDGGVEMDYGDEMKML